MQIIVSIIMPSSIYYIVKLPQADWELYAEIQRVIRFTLTCMQLSLLVRAMASQWQLISREQMTQISQRIFLLTGHDFCDARHATIYTRSSSFLFSIVLLLLPDTTHA